MLARNAESLYWIGRYVERADDTARILDVAVHQLLDDATVDPDRTSRLLLRVLGIEAPEGKLDVRSLTDLVAFSRNQVGSIVDSLASARENARGAREVTSSEMWECLNTTYNGLAERERASRSWGHTSSSAMWRNAQRCSRAWRIPRSVATTAIGSFCWAGRSNVST